MKVTLYESIVSEKLLQAFPQHTPPTLMNYAANLVGLPETIAVISMLWPQIIEVDGLVFLAETFHSDGRDSERPRFVGMTVQEKQRNEYITNAVSLGDFFFSEKIEILENEELLDGFGEALKFFWTLRLNMLFPERVFVVEIGHNIGSEQGQVITFYQRRGLPPLSAS